MDEIDHAQELEEIFREQALRTHFLKKNPPYFSFVKGKGAGICIDCGEDIEPARRAANPQAIRCVDCQRKTERRRHGIV